MSDATTNEPMSASPGASPNRALVGSFYWPQPVAWIVLAISVAASVGGWVISRQHAELEARTVFDEEATRVATALKERWALCEDVLHGAAGLYAASISVERLEWRAYVRSLSIEKRFPGMHSLGFVASVQRTNLEEFLKTTREDRMPEFQLREPGDGEQLFITKYIEPQGRHRAFLGRDLSRIGPARAAAEASRDGDCTVLSGVVAMDEEADGPPNGFLLLLPVYRNNRPHGTLEERRTHLEGWVYERFVIEDLVRPILARLQTTMNFMILDATDPDRPAPVYPMGQASRLAEGPPPHFANEIPLPVGGRNWRLIFGSTPSFERAYPRGSPVLVAAGGAALSLLLFGIAWSLTTTRQRALKLANEMTAALRASNQRLDYERHLLHTLMDNLPDRIYFKDRESRFLRNNRAHVRLFGMRDPAEAVGKRDADFFSAEHAQQAFLDEQEVIRTGRAFTKEERETWQDGNVTWVLTTKMPLRNLNGEIVGTFGISRDITDRKEGEEAMRRAKEAAESASVAKSHFLASMSHELRTPLNSIIGFANVLLKNRSGALTASELNFLDRIQANGKHLLGLINDILDLSKIEAQKLELRMAPVDLKVLVSETLAQEEGLVRDRPVRLVAELPARVAPMVTDGGRLKQVLINLLGNALKFTERGSVTVRVVTDPADDRPIRLDVCDTGIGIARDKLGVIFEAFQQAEAGTARKYGGTGLGLTISQALCEQMGCRIEVTSELGHGATFSILFPAGAPLVTGESPGGSVGPPPGPAAGLAGKLVLVIDDEADSRTLLAHLVSGTGCRVLTADSGEAGLQMAREVHPHLITLDLRMPGMNGWQVLQALKADPQLRGIPVAVIVVTAVDLNLDEISSLREATCGVLNKGEALEAELHRLLLEVFGVPAAGSTP